MKLLNNIKNIVGKLKADGYHLPLSLWQHHKPLLVLIVIFIASTICFITVTVSELKDRKALREQQELLQQQIAAAAEAEDEEYSGYVILPEYRHLYGQNNDFIGWLKIDDTVIDYPVMQCIEDENYYLGHDFYGEENIYGCLVLDNDSHAGIGTKQQEYTGGTKPTTNLMIHGHMTKTGEMFGTLQKYEYVMYGLKHDTIYFDTLYEKREYKLISAFHTKVYKQNDDVFKYYNFFHADTQEEFDYWYNNIMAKSLYDTGVTAEFGDEFITLSCCSYDTTDGRFVVVGKRVK